MEECELCGRTTKDVYVLDVENVELRTCASCAKGKKVVRIEREKPERKAKPTAMRPQKKSDEDRQLIENYGPAIRNAREKMRIPLKVLAEMINEKEHFLLRIEEQKTEPTIELRKKLEKALSIKLTDDSVEEGDIYKGGGRKTDEATIGDFVS